MGKVNIEGNYPVDEVLELSMDIGVNRHGHLIYGGLVPEDVAKQYIQKSAAKEIVNVSLCGELEFCGYPQDIDVEHRNDHHYLRITLVTSSQLMDVDPHDRFFQDTGHTFADILTEAFDDSGIGSLIAVRGNVSIRHPILQYRETDKEFALRMASRNGTVIIPNVASAEPQLMLGIPKRKTVDESNNIVYSVGRNANKYRNKSGIENQFDGRYDRYGNYDEAQKGYTLYEKLGYQNFLCYRMRSDNRYKLGDSVRVEGKVLTVMGKNFLYEHGEIVERYILGHEQDFAVPFRHDKKITGLELEGKVLDRSNQRLKILLDIDAHRKECGKTWFSYAPTTNNGMYSMPLVDEKVMLEWQSEADDDVLILRAARQNSQSMPHPGQRHFLTDHENHLKMVPGMVEYTNPVGSMKWLKGFGFDISTKKNMEIHAGQDVNIRSQAKTMISSPERIIACKAVTEQVDDEGTQVLKSISSIDLAGGDIHMNAATHVAEKSKAKNHKGATLPEREYSFQIKESAALKLAGAIPLISNAKNISPQTVKMMKSYPGTALFSSVKR